MKLRTLLVRLAIIAVVLIIAFAGYQYRLFLTGPELSIIQPDSSPLYVSTEFITVTGKAKNAAFLYINDRPVFTDDKGNFSEDIFLLVGYNDLTVRMIGKNREVITRNFSIVRNPPVSSGLFKVVSI